MPAKPSTAKPDKARAASRTGAAAVCPHCRQWETAIEDGYCSFCGHLLLPLDIQPDALILIPGLAPQKELSFRSASPQTLQATIVRRSGPEFPALTFEPAGTFAVLPGKELKVRVSVDAERLPADFQERVLDYVCLVNNDRRKQLPLRLTVRSGPRPRLLPPVLQFGEIQEGTVAERTLEVRNGGGIPLKVEQVLAQGSPRLRLKQAFASAFVAPGKTLAVPIVWDGGAPGGEDGDTPEIRLTFGHQAASASVPVQARTIRYGLEIEPSAIRLPAVLVKQDYMVEARIENSGSGDLEIAGIESDQPWLEVVSQARSLTLLGPDPDSRRPRPPSSTAFSLVYAFTVVCHPQGLPAGPHRGRITVRPVGHEPRSLAVEISVIHPEPYPDYIGIDFGTTNSVVALLDPDNYEIELVEDGLPGAVPSPLIPSILVFKDAETYVIGQAARNEMKTAPDRYVRSIKRIMGYDHGRQFFGRTFTPEELAERIIRQLVQKAEAKIHAQTGRYYDVRRAIITVPANFFDLQIRTVLKACAAAGLDTEEKKVQQAAQATREAIGQGVSAGIILDEPSAAVLYFIYTLGRGGALPDAQKAIDRQEGLSLLVFDYGGGTLDVSVANVLRLPGGEAGIRVLANLGDNGIGGDGIDLSLMRKILERCQADLQGFALDVELIAANLSDLEARRDREAWSDDVWQQVLGARMHWKDLSEAAKMQLAPEAAEQAEVTLLPTALLRVERGKVAMAPRPVKVSIPRSLLRDLLQETLAKCRRLVDSTLELARLQHGQIDYILHTGRQSLLPEVRECVHGLFPDLPPGHDILNEADLKVCVAKGAALYGSMRDRLVAPRARIHFLSEGRILPHSYGVERFSNFLEPEFDEIIARGRPYPTAEEKQYGPEMIPRSGYLNLKFYQNAGAGKAILRNPEVSLIGQISFDTLADGEPGCTVRIAIDENRQLAVFADQQAVELKPARLEGEEGWIG